MTRLLVTLTVLRGERKAAMTNSATARSRKRLANTNLPTPHGSSPLWGPGNVPGEWADVCGFITPPNTDGEWQTRGHGAFEDVLGIRPTDQSCTHEAWIHFSHANARLVGHIRTRNAAPSKTDDEARKEAILKNTCDHSLMQRDVSSTRQRVFPVGGRFHQGVRRMNPEANERQTFFRLSVCCLHFVPASFGSIHMPAGCTSHVVQGHRPASLFFRMSQTKEKESFEIC